MNRIATIAAGATLALAGTLGTIGTANAAQPVTRSQYVQVQPGLSRLQVRDLFGSHGVRVNRFASNGYTVLIKGYRAADGHIAYVGFLSTGGRHFTTSTFKEWCVSGADVTTNCVA